MANKFVAFFATDNGKSTAALLALIASGSGMFAKFLPHSALLDKTKEFLQLFKDGFPVPATANTMSKLEQVKTDLKLKEDIAKKIPSAFTVYGFDILHIGSAAFQTGVLVGVPINFNYTYPIKESDRKNILVGQKTVHWTSPDGISLESSLVLSDAAQKYAIAREVSKSNSYHVMSQSFLNGGAVVAYYVMTYNFNRKANLFARPLQIRLTLYTLLGTIVGTTWLLIKDFLTYHWEEKADEAAAGISEEYAQGALEFYTKILKRNLAMRSLLGDEGPKLFTALGNDRETFRTKHVPYVTLRDRAAQRCEALKKAAEPVQALAKPTQPVETPVA